MWIYWPPAQNLCFASLACRRFFQAMSWGMLLPWGVAIANRTKNVTNAAPGGWFKWHKKLQIIGALVPTFQAKRAENQSGKAVYAMVKFVFFWYFLEMSLVIAMKNLRLMLTGLEYHIWNSATVTGKMFKKQRFCWVWCCFPLLPTWDKPEDGLCSSWALEWLCGMCRKIVFTFPAFTTWLV